MDFIDKRIDKASESGKELIDYAAKRLGETIDQRIALAKSEISALLTEKLGEIRSELIYVTETQKKSALRNATVAIAASIAVALVSLLYRKTTAGALDLYYVFRSIALAIFAGQLVWIIAKLISNSINMSKVQKQFVLYVAQFTDAFKMKGLALHLIVMLTAAACWISLFLHSS